MKAIYCVVVSVLFVFSFPLVASCAVSKKVFNPRAAQRIHPVGTYFGFVQDLDRTLARLPHDKHETFAALDIVGTMLRAHPTDFEYKPGYVYPSQHIVPALSEQMRTVQRSLTSPAILELVKRLREHAIPAVALTTGYTGPFGVIPSLSDMRYEQLKSVGIDFSPLKSAYYQFKDFPPCQGNYPEYNKGILMTNDRTKGELLFAFLKAGLVPDLSPKTVIAFDDNMDYLKTIAQEARRNGVSFVGYYCQSRKGW